MNGTGKVKLCFKHYIFKNYLFLVEVAFHYCILSLCEMFPNTEFFLVRIFPHSDWMRRDTLYLSVFNPNAGKYGPEKNSVFGHFSRSVCFWP